MSIKTSDIMSILGDTNVNAVKLATQLEVGRIANNKVVELIKPKLPTMVRGYADNELFKVLVGNLVAFGLIKLRHADSKAMYVAEAMVNAASVQVAQSLNIEEFIDDILSKVNVNLNAEDTAETAHS